ncbi:unnamed protein product [Macrosiphum euphorbiae]|uniref:MADF domain-containing protein n=1 Tax=Macrosiphum euphorbiae TaxID=13131 RepID=A0AAV0WT38_9HEMI|nr:unnamed protein product [Macrosiphum euphorbiae]
MSTKWDCKTTIKFIEEYKSHDCLWDFKSSSYKNKHMRESAYRSIVIAMAIEGFGVPEVKTKIKNIRSTYAQEIKKIKESKKSGSGVDTCYVSNIQWLKELEPIYKDADSRTTFDNFEYNMEVQNVSTETTEEALTNELPESQSFTTQLPSQTKKKRTASVLSAVADLKSIHDAINKSEPEDDSFDMFGKSVAMQLKKFLSLETSLRAQSKIQNILTEMGIEELHSQKRSSTPLSYMNPSSVSSGYETSYSNMSEGSRGAFHTVENDNQNDLLHKAIFQTFNSTLEYSQ